MTDVESPGNPSQKLTSLLSSDVETVEDHYRDFYDWMINRGKHPVQHDPLSDATAENYLERVDKIHRLTIVHLNPDSETVITDDEADELLLLLARDEVVKDSGEAYHRSSKRKFSNAMQKYLEWRFHEGQLSFEWKPRVTFSGGQHTSAARFSYAELGQLLEEAKLYGSLPSFHNTTSEEQDDIRGLIAQRLGKPKERVTRQDWLRADYSKKFWSLITTGYDAALTPKEVAEARISWFDRERNVLEIPSEHATKERQKTEVGLADETVEALTQWLQERRQLAKYDGADRIWLNREDNPYRSGSLCNLLRKLCEEAGISIEGREIRWYSLRHTLGRNITDKGDRSEANDQLRHERFETTQGTYNDTPIEKLRQSVNATHRTANRAASDPDYDPFEDDAVSAGDQQQNKSAKRAESDSVETRINEHSVHIDSAIKDTTEARVDITRKILAEDED